jgi:hypothetical protein
VFLSAANPRALTKEQLQEIARKAAAARWGKKKQGSICFFRVWHGLRDQVGDSQVWRHQHEAEAPILSIGMSGGGRVPELARLLPAFISISALANSARADFDVSTSAQEIRRHCGHTSARQVTTGIRL